MDDWTRDAIFYHIYPLGHCGAPKRNDFSSPSESRLRELLPWLAHARGLGATAFYLGPVFESSSHGYDTADFFRVDRRLGTQDDLRELVDTAHTLGMRVVVDAVFPHVGRDFWAFRDLLAHGERSAYREWFRGVDFAGRSAYGDSFSYEYWRDAPELPRLNLTLPAVTEHLLAALDGWVRTFDIDGLRLDSADSLDDRFLRVLREHAAALKPGFWLMGEVIHGDYRRWANPHALHSVTNYEAYKGLWSSHVDRNFFEIAYSLERIFGRDGMYRDIATYNFADNHDVDRVASKVPERAQLFSLYSLLYTMPGIPSLYAGSEWGLQATRTPSDDSALRPALDLERVRTEQPPDLPDALRRLASVRGRLLALRRGDYRQLAVAAEQLAFVRWTDDAAVVVAVNAAPEPATIAVEAEHIENARLIDDLNPPYAIRAERRRATFDVPPRWARILRVER